MTAPENASTATEILLRNEQTMLVVDLFGGAFTDFHLHADKVNPLSFKFSREQMPENNKDGAPYQGHFLCAGRWGEPSAGEKRAGVPNHGEIANLLWDKVENSDRHLTMSVTGSLEGLRVNRSVALDRDSAVFAVEETVINVSALGRLYNMVQHPTLGQPFLDQYTLVDSNAGEGFNQKVYQQADLHNSEWPVGNCGDGSVINLRNPERAYNSVFSFVLQRPSRYGWITAYSPSHHLLLGYIWKREDYPWVHFWQHWENNEIRYRGLEFGTAGIHQPFKEILATQSMLYGENTCAYIDAGESVSRRYMSFLMPVPADFSGVEGIEIRNGMIQITGKEREQDLYLQTSFNDFL